MLTIPTLGFKLQDTAQPIPNLNTNLLVGNYAELTSAIPVLRADFINVNMSSSITGGVYNQSFEVGADAPSLNISIPRVFVEANIGNYVQLLLRISRNRVISSAPTATVSINKGPVVVPPPQPPYGISAMALSKAGYLRGLTSAVCCVLAMAAWWPTSPTAKQPVPTSFPAQCR